MNFFHLYYPLSNNKLLKITVAHQLLCISLVTDNIKILCTWLVLINKCLNKNKGHVFISSFSLYFLSDPH